MTDRPQVARVPADALASFGALGSLQEQFDGAPLLVVVDPSPNPVASAETAAVVAELPALTVAAPGLPASLAAACDLVARDGAALGAIEEAFKRFGLPLVAAAILVRTAPASVFGGLAAESAVYSALQAGARFQHWLAERPRATRADGAKRVRATVVSGVLEVVLTRPERHNALDRRMRDELWTGLQPALGDPRLSVVLRGDGPSFSSGGDLNEFGEAGDPARAHIVRVTRSLGALFARLSRRMVVGIHGYCLGAGIELPAFAGRVVAADDCVIGLPEPTFGLVPGAGGTVSIPARCGPQRFMQLLLLGPVDAATALAWGLVDEVVPRARLADRVRELARSGGLE